MNYIRAKDTFTKIIHNCWKIASYPVAYLVVLIVDKEKISFKDYNAL